MIFVTVGTNEAPFDRLVTAAGLLATGDQVVVQHGSSLVRPTGVRCVDFLTYEELVEAIRRSRIVVAHAGVGSVMTALANGKRPIVVPRRRRYGEAVDDHQLEFARAVAEVGLVETVENPMTLGDAIARSTESRAIELGPARRLVHELRAFVEDRVDPPPGHP